MSFDDDEIGDKMTQSDVKQLEQHHQVTLQELKEEVLGTVSKF